MRRLIAVTVLLLCGPTSGATDAGLEFLKAPVDKLGSSIRSVTLALKEPEQVTTVLIPNPHQPPMRNVRTTLKYPGLKIVVLTVLCCDGSYLERVEITDLARARSVGLAAPAIVGDVVRRLGPPDARTARSMAYHFDNEVGRETVTFRVNGSRVTGVVWEYWID